MTDTNEITIKPRPSLNQFMDIHKGKDIYVIGSGKSCDYLSPSFFEGKITIGINHVYKKFNCNYYVRKESEMLDEILREITDNSILFITEGKCGEIDNKINLENINKHHNHTQNVVTCSHYAHCGREQGYKNIKTTHFEKNKNTLISTSSTICTGIHLAHYMGAKNIILVGHDCCKLDGKSNFKNYHTDKTLKIVWKNQEQYNNWLNEIEKQTIHVKKILQGLGTNIVSLNPFVSYKLEGHVKS